MPEIGPTHLIKELSLQLKGFKLGGPAVAWLETLESWETWEQGSIHGFRFISNKYKDLCVMSFSLHTVGEALVYILRTLNEPLNNLLVEKD